ncbi:MAG: hypothetical protein IKZ55_04735 [Bacteroidales bacterium]|nr:hypothetical protein [Bacteroidales bacterium]
MEKQSITKTDFQKLLKSIGDETFKIVFEGDVWYEQLTDNETVYSRKLFLFKELKSYDALKRNANEAHQPVDKLSSEGEVYAYVCVCGTVINYYLVPIMKRPKRRALELTTQYSNWVVKMRSSNPPRITRTVREVA